MISYLIQSPLEHYAITTPHQPALNCLGKTLSYAELDCASNQLANTLRRNGVRPQDRIGIFHHKALELGVAIYGVLKAGCIFVPLDPLMPVERLALILDDCDITHIVSSDLLVEVIESLEYSSNLTLYGVNIELKCQQVTWDDIYSASTIKPDPEIMDQDLGYLMYTSGTTGIPKGMMHSHNGSITYARWGAEQFELEACDRVASHAPLHFDLSIFDFFSTAQAGATVVLVPEAITKFPASWTELIAKEKITVLFTVPYTLIMMLEQGVMEKRDLSSLRWILFGGEPFPPRILRELMERMEHTRFTNVYGPAEAPCCTIYDIPRPLPEGDEPLPIGTVSKNSADIIVNEQDAPCEIGESGELCIRSSTLTKGYWNRPELNQVAYLERVEFSQLNCVYYRTGDRVVRHTDGMLRFLGRMDRMVKTRGHRVELDEVEAALASHEDVHEVAAFLIPDQHGSNAILAQVVLVEGANIDSSVLLVHVRKKLPLYAVPQEIKLSNYLPRTSTGKIDRKQLQQNSQYKTR